MKIKSLIILMIGAVVIGMSAISVPAEEINRTNDVPTEDISVEEQNSEEPVLIAPYPNDEPLEDEISGEGEILPSMDRGEPVPFDATVEEGSEPSLISEADTNSKNNINNSNTPVILIIGAVGLLIILLLAINRKK